MSKFKKGAASFYIVAISTLILVIIAASFAAVIISEITRTSNDDLAQSAYDSALAGVEDAKLAYYSYQSCLESNSCSDEMKTLIMNANNGNGDCDMVARILGRVGPDEKHEVMIEETSGVSNNMQQAYTCTQFATKTDDIKATIGESNPSYVVRVKFDDSAVDDSAVNDVINKIKTITVEWGSVEEGSSSDVGWTSDGGIFSSNSTTPAVLMVEMIQTAETFNLSDFEVTKVDPTGRRYTDRGAIFLVPKTENTESNNDSDKYKIAENNYINEGAFLDSNLKTIKNLPYAVMCDDNGEYKCKAIIEIPIPVGGNRNKDTFMFRVSLPYKKPTTDFKLSFDCGKDTKCSSEHSVNGEGEIESIDSSRAILDNVQVKIDSTGRANDLYRRVEIRLEPESPNAESSLYPLYAVWVENLKKNLSPTCENDFIQESNCKEQN